MARIWTVAFARSAVAPIGAAVGAMTGAGTPPVGVAAPPRLHASPATLIATAASENLLMRPAIISPRPRRRPEPRPHVTLDRILAQFPPSSRGALPDLDGTG